MVEIQVEKQVRKENTEETSSKKANQINVSSNQRANFYVSLGKKYLDKHQKIEMHAIGNAISTSAIAAENIAKNNYARYGEIKTFTVG